MAVAYSCNQADFVYEALGDVVWNLIGKRRVYQRILSYAGVISSRFIKTLVHGMRT